jgi:hypothetical protein
VTSDSVSKCHFRHVAIEIRDSGLLWIYERMNLVCTFGHLDSAMDVSAGVGAFG